MHIGNIICYKVEEIIKVEYTDATNTGRWQLQGTQDCSVEWYSSNEQPDCCLCNIIKTYKFSFHFKHSKFTIGTKEKGKTLVGHQLLQLLLNYVAYFFLAFLLAASFLLVSWQKGPVLALQKKNINLLQHIEIL